MKKLLSKYSWPETCVYNVGSSVEASMAGEADVEIKRSDDSTSSEDSPSSTSQSVQSTAQN